MSQMFPGGGQQGCRQGTDKGGVSHDQDRGVRGPLRCYKCLERGHVRSNCTDTDRSDVCYRCGEPGHVARLCGAQLKCAEARLPQNHRVGVKTYRSRTQKNKEEQEVRKTSAPGSASAEKHSAIPTDTDRESIGKKRGVFDPPPAIKGEFEMEVDLPIMEKEPPKVKQLPRVLEEDHPS